MSLSDYGSAMDRNSIDQPPAAPGTAKKLRGRAPAAPQLNLSLSPGKTGTGSNAATSPPKPATSIAQPAISRPVLPPPVDVTAGKTATTPSQISRWTPSPPSYSPVGSEPHRPFHGRLLQGVQRLSRPSRLAPIIDQSQPSEPAAGSNSLVGRLAPADAQQQLSPADTPVAHSPSQGPQSDLSTSASSSTPGPSRRSASLGPPPSSRRGASSFYSNTTLVFPIPEESPWSRSHESYASSAAIPEAWTNSSPVPSSDYSEDSSTDKSGELASDDFGDESKLVTGRRKGRKHKSGQQASRSTSHKSDARTPPPPPPPLPAQYLNAGIGHTDIPIKYHNTPSTFKPAQATPPSMMYAAGSASGIPPRVPVTGSRASLTDGRIDAPLPPPPRRLSKTRIPIKLDIESMRAPETRGSMTSLPDLIRRATRLAAMIERGKRPTSRGGDLSRLAHEKGAAGGGADGEAEGEFEGERSSRFNLCLYDIGRMGEVVVVTNPRNPSIRSDSVWLVRNARRLSASCTDSSKYPP